MDLVQVVTVPLTPSRLLKVGRWGALEIHQWVTREVNRKADRDPKVDKASLLLLIIHLAPTYPLPALLRHSIFTLTARMVLTVKTHLMVRIAALALRLKIKVPK
jgi:hypothetical protein